MVAFWHDETLMKLSFFIHLFDYSFAVEANSNSQHCWCFISLNGQVF